MRKHGKLKIHEELSHSFILNTAMFPGRVRNFAVMRVFNGYAAEDSRNSDSRVEVEARYKLRARGRNWCTRKSHRKVVNSKQDAIVTNYLTLQVGTTVKETSVPNLSWSSVRDRAFPLSMRRRVERRKTQSFTLLRFTHYLRARDVQVVSAHSLLRPNLEARYAIIIGGAREAPAKARSHSCGKKRKRKTKEQAETALGVRARPTSPRKPVLRNAVGNENRFVTFLKRARALRFASVEFASQARFGNPHRSQTSPASPHFFFSSSSFYNHRSTICFPPRVFFGAVSARGWEGGLLAYVSWVTRSVGARCVGTRYGFRVCRRLDGSENEERRTWSRGMIRLLCVCTAPRRFFFFVLIFLRAF